MKKKENLWELLERLDEEAGQFNQNLSEANRYFNAAAKQTQTILERQEKQLHDTIAQVKRSLKAFMKERDDTKEKKTKE